MSDRTRPQAPLVMKFGGACFLDLADFQAVADFIVARLAQARRVAAVVSAMSGTTGNLQRAQRQLSDRPPAHLIAQLLTTGETVSAALLATALHRNGVQARATATESATSSRQTAIRMAPSRARARQMESCAPICA